MDTEKKVTGQELSEFENFLADLLSELSETDFLKEFYYGNLELGVCSKEGYSREHLKSVTRFQEKLREQFTPEQWELFMDYSALMTEFTEKESCRMFMHGYRTAVRMIVAGLIAK